MHSTEPTWFGDYVAGPAVVLAHGGMGNAGNFGHQVPALVNAGYRVIAVYTRGHGAAAGTEPRFPTSSLPRTCLRCLTS